MVFKWISKLTWSRPPSAWPNWLDHAIQLHLQTCSIAAWKCISILTRSRLPSASPYSLDHGLAVHLISRWITASNCISNTLDRGLDMHLHTCLIVASKCSSKLARSLPRSVSQSLLDPYFQAHLQAGQDRVCISYNEMMSIYPGDYEIYTACRWFPINTMYFGRWEPPGVSERMWSVNLEASISGEYQTLGGHSDRPSE